MFPQQNSSPDFVSKVWMDIALKNSVDRIRVDDFVNRLNGLIDVAEDFIKVTKRRTIIQAFQDWGHELDDMGRFNVQLQIYELERVWNRLEDDIGNLLGFLRDGVYGIEFIKDLANSGNQERDALYLAQALDIIDDNEEIISHNEVWFERREAQYYNDFRQIWTTVQNICNMI
jgi:hypothetical protein